MENVLCMVVTSPFGNMLSNFSRKLVDFYFSLIPISNVMQMLSWNLTHFWPMFPENTRKTEILWCFQGV